mgnify:CR=1 FL=1
MRKNLAQGTVLPAGPQPVVFETLQYYVLHGGRSRMYPYAPRRCYSGYQRRAKHTGFPLRPGTDGSAGSRRSTLCKQPRLQGKRRCVDGYVYNAMVFPIFVL